MARPNNSKDKNRAFLNNRLKDMYGDDFDPIIKMSEAAMTMQRLTDQKISALQDEQGNISDKEIGGVFVMLKEVVAAWEKPAKFITPQLKAMEHSIGDDTVDDISELMDHIADGNKSKPRKKS